MFCLDSALMLLVNDLKMLMEIVVMVIVVTVSRPKVVLRCVVSGRLAKWDIG